MSSFTSHPCQTLRPLIKRRKWTIVAFNNWLLLLLLQINSTEILNKQPQFSEIFYSSLDWSRPKIVAPTGKKGLLLLLLFQTKKKLPLLQNSGLQKWTMLLLLPRSEIPQTSSEFNLSQPPNFHSKFCCCYLIKKICLLLLRLPDLQISTVDLPQSTTEISSELPKILHISKWILMGYLYWFFHH